MESQNKQSLDSVNLIFQHKNVKSVGMCRIANSDIWCLCRPTIAFCRNSIVLMNSWSMSFLQMSATKSCLDLYVISCERDPRPCCLWNWFCLSLLVSHNNELIPWEGFRGEPDVENWLPKTFSSNPSEFHVSNGKRLSRLSMEEELGIIAVLTGNVRQCPTVIRFHFLEFSWIIQRIHPIPHFLQLRSVFLCCFMVFSKFLHWDFINSKFLSSFHVSHLVHTSDLSVSEKFFFHRFFWTSLFSSRFNISMMGVL